ncbi:ABC transporter permease [Actinomyces sp. oral taxon 180]|uniref:ABC transporter permease n=1 Tax=Actinomyces sp. oral taxon 180 TaxID=651609 RepID=UPI0001F11D2D|nr:ABC transporter permease [Actinomyces sp. oral taxon 180]EFU60742.1 ABC superfamily ATP binding cassette transporter, membrane protein [Actinomyces sp. oral taxon 180 str. F0310]
MLSLRRLPWMNLRGYPVRTGTLVLFSALMTMTIFGGTMLVQGIERGLATVQSRLGADIMVTPADAGNDFDAQSFLVHAEASYFYMPTSTSEAVAAVDGVQSSSPQLFLASARASCCSGRYQVIAFDPGSDFTVQPWIADSVGQAQLGHMDVIVGANVSVYDTDNFALFGQRLHVVGKFDPTGSTLDNAVYTNFDTAKILIDSSLRKGLNKYTSLDTDDIISSVMVKVAPGRDIDAVAADIERSVPGVSVTTSTRMVSGIAQSLEATSRTVVTLIALVWGVGLLMITLIFVMMIIERKREFASLIVAGAHRGLVSRIILAESLTVNAIGGVAGIVISGVLIASFSGLVRQTIGTGFLVPPISTMALLAVASLAAIAVVALVASWISVRSIRVMDAGSLLKEGE